MIVRVCVQTRQGHRLRLVGYPDPVSGESYELLTNDLPPGVIVELYRRRWEAEKRFDQIKHKLGEQKAWAMRLVAEEARMGDTPHTTRPEFP